MTALQQIIKEAQSIRRKSPKIEWKKAVAQASSIYSSKNKGKKKVVKKVAKKKATKKKLVGKVDKKLKKGLATKGLKMPHGYDVVKRKRKIGAVKKSATTMHKDTKSHNVKISVMSGIKVGMLPTYKDKDAAREIQLYADNDSMLYYQRRNPILKNLSKKYLKGTYDVDKAAKLWRYYIDAAMQKYQKEFGTRGDKWYDLLSVPDRNLLALDYAIRTKQEFELGNTY
jgi:hypothetical protein